MNSTAPDVEGKPSLDIVRDLTFVRFVADEALFSAIGRDVEVAFIQYGTLFQRQYDLGDEEATEATSILTEVARMRIGYPALVNFVMAVLRTGIEEGKIKADAVVESLSSWGESAAAESDKEK